MIPAMAIQVPQPPNGMRDHLPEDYRERLALADRIRGVYAKYGYAPIETPAMERIEVLKGNDPENEKLMFEVLKRGEKLEEAKASGDALADQALRFDLTVPLARFYAANRAKLPPVFRCQHIGPVWRADRPQKGRFREFMQCDVDAVGSASPAMEAEVILATAEVFRDFFGEAFAVHLNDRRLLTVFLNQAGIPTEQHPTALIALDKLDKIGEDGVRKELAERGIPEAKTEALLAALKVPGDLSRLHPEAAAALATIQELTKDQANVRFDPHLVRGQDYYTGPIFEVRMEAFPGAMAGGGRYDEMIGRFLGTSVPAVGFSIGFERLLLVLKEKNLPLASNGCPQVFIPLMEAAFQAQAFALGAALRAKGLNVVVQPEAGKLVPQLKTADEVLGIPFAAICEPGGKVTLKHLKTRTSGTPLSVEDAVKDLCGRLTP